MTTTPMTAEHLPDGDLVRLLDGEMDAPERAHTEAHVAGCAECRRRLETLRRRSVRLGELLIASDWETPPLPSATPDELARRRANHPWLRAAALVAVLLGAVMLASPARAWIAEWIGIQREDAAMVAPPSPAPAATAADPAAGTRVQFTPVGEDFDLEFVTHQAGGAVRLRTHPERFASAEVIGGAGGADLLVLPSGLRVQNAPESTAEYLVILPAQTQRVRVRIARDGETVLTREEIATGKQVELWARARTE